MQSNSDKDFAFVCLFDCFVSPVAAAGEEWINVDQQGELFET